MPAPTVDVPGRGAWRTTGGLLPLKPGSTSTVGYYRLATTGETPIGSGWVRGTSKTYTARVVNTGVKALQALCGLPAADCDGWFGAKTDTAVRDMQARLALTVDGVVGRATMRGLLLPLVTAAAASTKVPVDILGGIIMWESALDPAAVGVNGFDLGIAQINLGAHWDDVSVEEALDPGFALAFTATDLQRVHSLWDGRTRADPWDIAVANHNSPALASQWAKTGVPPYVEGRVIQIADYVSHARTAW